MKQKAILFLVASLGAVHQTAQCNILSYFSYVETGLDNWRNASSPSKLYTALCAASALAGIGLRVHYIYKTLNKTNAKPVKTMGETSKTKGAAPFSLFILLIEKVLPLIRVISENQQAAAGSLE